MLRVGDPTSTYEPASLPQHRSTQLWMLVEEDFMFRRKKERFTLIVLFVICLSTADKVNADTHRGELCDAADLAMTRAQRETLPIYHKYWNTWGPCVATDGTATNDDITMFYADSNCSQEVSFIPLPEHHDLCLDLYAYDLEGDSAPIQWGNASFWQDEYPGTEFPETPWSVARGTRWSITLYEADDLNVPFMKRVAYKENVSAGCSLEMRIYKSHMNETNLRPLLMLHGGAWNNRSGYLPVEGEIAHFTERGYIVFAPFYRVAGDKSVMNFGADDSCNSVKMPTIVQDVEDALAWIHDHGTTFGARNMPVDVLGGSAGGHLALWLAYSSNYKEFINRLVLFYPVTDVAQCIYQLHDMDPNHPDLEIFDLVFESEIEFQPDGSLSEALQQELVGHNFASQSVPAAWGGQTPPDLPPVYLMIGKEDRLLDQAKMLCSAYATGDANREDEVLCDTGNVDAVVAGQEFNTRCACGTGQDANGNLQGNRMDFVHGAGHGFDACAGIDNTLCATLLSPLMDTNARDFARESWERMLDWLDGQAPQNASLDGEVLHLKKNHWVDVSLTFDGQSQTIQITEDDGYYWPVITNRERFALRPNADSDLAEDHFFDQMPSEVPGGATYSLEIVDYSSGENCQFSGDAPEISSDRRTIAAAAFDPTIDVTISCD